MVLGESGLKYIDIIVKITAPLKEWTRKVPIVKEIQNFAEYTAKIWDLRFSAFYLNLHCSDAYSTGLPLYICIYWLFLNQKCFCLLFYWWTPNSMHACMRHNTSKAKHGNSKDPKLIQYAEPTMTDNPQNREKWLHILSGLSWQVRIYW
jgi:hypothetical protein